MDWRDQLETRRFEKRFWEFSVDFEGWDAGEVWVGRLAPSTVRPPKGSRHIVLGDVLSKRRFCWAVIAAFITFMGGGLP